MKKFLILFVAMFAMINQLVAQPTNEPTFIKGAINIKYNSRATATPTKGVTDVYNVNINVCNSALFHGTIVDTPQIIDGWISKGVVQPRSLNYDIACDVVNPKNPAQTKNVGRLFGIVPISSDGVYGYDKGTLQVSVLPMGNAGGFDSKFNGTAAGKPLNRPVNWFNSLQQEAVNLTRSINGKTTKIVLKKYDKMTFNQHVIAAGPVHIYQPITVNGELFYDYDKFSWFFNNVTMQYAINGVIKIDRLTGNIRWVESPQRKSNGEGEYQFDIRVNEPAPSETAAFSHEVVDESSFFETDINVPALVGSMKYKDTLKDGNTMASVVTVDLKGNNINKQQAMALCKLILFSTVVPMNSD